jgi:hypothetical protein
MEELLVRIILSLDRLSQKPLRRAVPDLDHLLADPADYFRYQEVTIGPWRRWAGGIGLGILLWLGLMAISGIILGLTGGNPAGPVGQFRYAVLVIVLPPVCLLLGMYWMRGGSCVLNAAGARLLHGGIEVFCPWSLFSAPGQPIIHPIDGRNQFELPVTAAAVPLVEARGHDLIIAQGMAIKTRQLHFRSPQEVSLRSLYRVKPDELAWLLLQLGRSLGCSTSALKEWPAQGHYQGHVQSYQPAEDLAVGQIAPALPAVREKDGWITVSLTRLGFPPWCCNCGAPTTSTQAFRAFTPFLRLGRFLNIEGAEHVWVHVPVCKACQDGTRRRYRKAFWRTFLLVVGIGAGGGFLAGTLLALVHGDPKLFPLIPGVFSFLAGSASLFFAWFLAIWAAGKGSAPVQVQRYLPDKGTASLRFRRTEYAEQILHAMQLETTSGTIQGM